ncbi:MAG: hypothetical protein P4M08_05715 [Oligoflexia bacterium]|nr:hypothetical protein [Oligoflexia bacterium]
MFSLLWVCNSCGGRLSDNNALLCPACLQAIHPAPPLCPSCGSPVCDRLGKCESPWLAEESSLIRSYAALYLLIEPGYSVLRAWKKRGSPIFDRQILRWDEETRRKLLETQAQAIVPIPQQIKRSWKLGRSPAEVIARWLSKNTALPMRRILRPPSRWLAGQPPRQAQRSVQERMENPLRFKAIESRIGGLTQVILVDDFMTSGRTIKAASQALGKAGIGRVDVFCLGVRPRLRRLEE